MPVSFTQPQNSAEHIISDLGSISYDDVSFVANANLKAGAVLGIVTASGLYKEFDAGASDGSQTAAAILISDIEFGANGGRSRVTTRLSEINSGLLVWRAGTTTNQRTTALASLATRNIIARTGVQL